jgi:hypothetical protein
MSDTKAQIEVAERLQMKLLARYEALLDEGGLSAADASNLQRLLLQNGWVLDPAKLPKNLRSLLEAPDKDLEMDIPHRLLTKEA